MRYVPIKRLLPDMMVAQAIYDSYNKILINKGVRLSSEYIKQLEKRGVIGAYIEDDISKQIIVHQAISNELRNKACSSIRDFDIQSTINISKNIVDALLENDSVMFDLVDLRTFDDYTYRHSVNVAVLSTIVGMGMDFKYDDLTDLCLGALLHDIGKLEIAPEILNKPGKLTDEEYNIVKQHPATAYNLVKNRWDISSTSKIGMLCHHENSDGSGYPYGLKEEKIHRFARIIHVADVYDALTSKRPYKDPYPPNESAEFLMASCGTLFDRQVVEVFLGYVPLYARGTMVLLSDGNKALVVENYKFNTMRPKVFLFEKNIEYDLANDPNLRSITIVGLVDNE